MSSKEQKHLERTFMKWVKEEDPLEGWNLWDAYTRGVADCAKYIKEMMQKEAGRDRGR